MISPHDTRAGTFLDAAFNERQTASTIKSSSEKRTYPDGGTRIEIGVPAVTSTHIKVDDFGNARDTRFTY